MFRLRISHPVTGDTKDMSSAQTLFLAPTIPFRHHSRPRTKSFSPPLCRDPPPKPVFYKSPSRAIERGGGFFIPGLQGPRLRIAVSLLVCSALTANHLAAPPFLPRTFSSSEALALTSSLAVLVSGLLDSSRQRAAEIQREVELAERAEKALQGASGSDVGQGGEIGKWGCSVASDMMEITGVGVWREGEMEMQWGDVGNAAMGEVVRRVAESGRGIYIQDSTELPEEATMPWLNEGNWSIVVTAVMGKVVVFVKKFQGSALPPQDRVWLEEVAKRMVQGDK